MNRSLKYLFALGIAAAAWILFSPLLATSLIVERPLDRADAIIVLSGSAVYKERMHKAAELYKQQVAPLILLTDDGSRAGWSRGEQVNLPFVELAKRRLVTEGVAPEAIVILPGVVAGTDDEARALAEELAARPLAAVIVVTSAYHSRRALRTFEKILGDDPASIGIDSAPPGMQTPGPNYWWTKPRGWQMVAGEYVKSLVYYAYY